MSFVPTNYFYSYTLFLFYFIFVCLYVHSTFLILESLTTFVAFLFIVKQQHGSRAFRFIVVLLNEI